MCSLWWTIKNVIDPPLYALQQPLKQDVRVFFIFFKKILDTGSFYKGFDLRFTDQSAIGVFSRDSKTPKLVEKYGFSIFEFTEENRKEIDIQIVEKKLEEWLAKQIQAIYTKI